MLSVFVVFVVDEDEEVSKAIKKSRDRKLLKRNNASEEPPLTFMKKWREREKEMGNAFETSLGFFNGKWERDPRWVIKEEKKNNKK